MSLFFIRSKNHLALNDTGVYAAEHVRRVLAADREWETQVHSFDRSLHTISIGFCAPIPQMVLTPVINTLFQNCDLIGIAAAAESVLPAFPDSCRVLQSSRMLQHTRRLSAVGKELAAVLLRRDGKANSVLCHSDGAIPYEAIKSEPRNMQHILRIQRDCVGASDTFYSFMNGIIPTDSPSEEVINIDDLTVDAALRFIRQRPADKPFFLFLGLTFPHPPYQIEQKYYDLIDAQKLPPRIAELAADKPKMEQALRKELGVAAWSEERFDELRRVYLAMCAKVDDQLGRVLACLKDEGIYDDTAVLFFSDHGDYTGDYGIVEKAQNCFPECLTRVPLVIKAPKSVPIDPGVNDNLVELTDVCATVADLAGITVERQSFSQSLLPTMRDKHRPHRAYTVCEGGRLPEETHCSEFSEESFSINDLYAPRQSIQGRSTGEHTKAAMIRTTQYKYVCRLQEEDEFYILAEGENTNHIYDPSYAKEIAAHKEAMLDWYMRTCDLVPKSPDDRFPFEFLENNMTAMGIPKAASKAIKLWLRLRGESAGQFADKMRRKAGH